MKTSEALYELIHSLTKNEKRYFKLYCSGLSGRDGSNYLLLFEALERQKEYDGEALKKTLKKPSLVKNLSSEKNYLFNLILDSLLVYHKEQPEHRMRIMMSKAQLLFDKSLEKPGLKLLAAAKKFAQAYENRNMVLDILQQERAHNFNKVDVDELRAGLEEEQKLVNELMNINGYNILLTNLIRCSKDTVYSRDASKREKLDMIMSHELLRDERLALSLVARILFHHTWAYYYHLVKERSKVIDANKNILLLLEANPAYTSVNLNDYLSVLSNMLSDAISVRSKSNVLFVIAKLEAFPEVFREYISPVVRDNHYQLFMESSVKANAWLGEFDNTTQLVPQLKALLDDERLVRPHRRQNISFYTAYALFAKGQYKDALRWLQELADVPQVYAAYIYYLQGMFLRLMIHYELGNEDVLQQQSQSLRQLLTREQKLHRTEQELLSFFNRLSEATSQKEAKHLFNEMLQLLDTLHANEFEFPIINALMFVLHWVKAKALDRSLDKVVQEHHL